LLFLLGSTKLKNKMKINARNNPFKTEEPKLIMKSIAQNIASGSAMVPMSPNHHLVESISKLHSVDFSTPQSNRVDVVHNTAAYILSS